MPFRAGVARVSARRGSVRVAGGDVSGANDTLEPDGERPHPDSPAAPQSSPDTAGVVPDNIVLGAEHVLVQERPGLARVRLRGSRLRLALRPALETFVRRVSNGRQLPAWDAVAALSPTVTMRVILGSAAAALGICALGFA